MKSLSHQKRAIFGTDAERYISRLLMLAQNEDGSRMPDLISVPSPYNPKFLLEVKSTKERKGILVDYQLCYSITSYRAYRKLLEEFPEVDDLFLKGIGISSIVPKFSKSRTAYYYDIIDRVDGTKPGGITGPYNSIRFEFGDQYLVPGDFIFWTFATEEAHRTKSSIDVVAKNLRKMMLLDLSSETIPKYEKRKGEPGSWHNAPIQDIKSIFFRDKSLLRAQSQRDRVQALYDNYPKLKKLERIVLPGPNNTRLYVLSDQRDSDLFNFQIRKTLEERIPIIERICRQRRRSMPLLKKVPSFDNSTKDLFNDGADAYDHSKGHLTPTELERLERLACWLDKGESIVPLKQKEEFTIF